MNINKLNLMNELKELEKIKKEAETFLASAPIGKLRISKSHGRVQYYHRIEVSDISGRYLKKSEQEIAQLLAQKEYARKILLLSEEKIELIKKYFLKDFPDKFVEVFQKFSVERQELIKPYILTDIEFRDRWKKEKIQIKKNHENENFKYKEISTGIFTEAGEEVRSKSEKILADKFYMLKIPYIYECPCWLEGVGYVRPDFTVLNMCTRKEYIWEHFGMMGDPDYAMNTIKKIEKYEINNIFPGEKLIFTFESDKSSLNIKNVERKIHKYLI